MHSARPPENDALDGGLWVSIGEVARAKGKTRQSVHERVGHLVDAGLLEVRREGRTKLINLAQYDIAIGATGDGVKEAGAATKRDAIGEAMSPKFREAQTRERQYVADLKFLELQERLRKLVPISEVESAVQICAATIVESLERLPRRADDLALAVGRDGAHGAR